MQSSLLRFKLGINYAFYSQATYVIFRTKMEERTNQTVVKVRTRIIVDLH